MRRFALVSLATVFASYALLAHPPVAHSQNQPPHAWLFGTWTGGLFPPPERLTAQACFSQPVVIFTRDLVMRATLTEQTLTQLEVETARATSTGVEFHFSAPAVTPRMFGGGVAGTIGFGCPIPDGLTVQRRGENEISFPDCADFPYPLVRCH
jgi:hypothetical protein